LKFDFEICKNLESEDFKTPEKIYVEGGRQENFDGIYAVFVLKMINELVVSGNNLPFNKN